MGVNISDFAQYRSEISEVTAISAGSIEFEIGSSRVHNFAGAVFFNDASGTAGTEVQPTAGTTTFTVKLVVQPHAFQTVTDGVLNANEACQVDWNGNTLSIKATFAGIVGATHARIIWASNSA